MVNEDMMKFRWRFATTSFATRHGICALIYLVSSACVLYGASTHSYRQTFLICFELFKSWWRRGLTAEFSTYEAYIHILRACRDQDEHMYIIANDWTVLWVQSCPYPSTFGRWIQTMVNLYFCSSCDDFNTNLTFELCSSLSAKELLKACNLTWSLVICIPQAFNSPLLDQIQLIQFFCR